MGIVVNVPKDTRFGNLGRGIGDITSAIIKNRKKKDRVKLLGEVSAGTKTVQEAINESGDEDFLASILAARKNYTANNPSKTFVQTDEIGSRITGSRTGRIPKPGEVPIDIARFNKPPTATKPTDKGREINDIIEAEGATWNTEGVEAKRLPSVRRTMARNVRDLQNLSNDYIKSVSKVDRFGNITGTNAIKVAAYEEAINGYARGTGGFDRVLGKQDLSRKAKAYADEAWRLAEAEGMTETDLIDEKTDAGILQSVAVKLRQGGYHGAANVLDPEGMWSEPGGGTGDEIVPDTVLDKPAAAAPATPLQEVDRYVAGLSAVEESGIEVTPNYGMVDIGPQMPLVPEDVMIVARELGTNEAVELYRSIYPNEITTIPLPLLEQRIQQNMHKQPMSFDIQAPAPATAPAPAAPAIDDLQTPAPAVPIAAPVAPKQPFRKQVETKDIAKLNKQAGQFLLNLNKNAGQVIVDKFKEYIDFYKKASLTFPTELIKNQPRPEDIVKDIIGKSDKQTGNIIIDPSMKQIAEFMQDEGLGTFNANQKNKREIVFDPDWNKIFDFMQRTNPNTATTR